MSEELKHKIYSPTDCISEKMMFDYIDNKLTPKERHSVEKHMLDCELCSDAFEGLELLTNRGRIPAINLAINERVAPIIEAEKKIFSINYKIIFSIAAAISLLVVGVFFFDQITSKEMKQNDVAELKNETSQTPPPPPMDESPSAAQENKEGLKITEDKGKEAQLETATKSADQEIALSEEQQSVSDYKNTETPAFKNQVSTGESSGNGDVAVESAPVQLDDMTKNIPSESSAISQNEVSDREKDSKLDEAKKAEEKTVRNTNTTNPNNTYYSTTPVPDQNQKSDKRDGDDLVLAKATPSSKKNRSESGGKDKMKAGKDSNSTEVSGTKEAPAKAAYEPQNTAQDNDAIKTETVSTTTRADSTEGTFRFAEQMPQYPGGQSAMMKFIQKNLKYPSKDDEGNVLADLTIEFVVNASGKAIDPKLIKPKSNKLEKEVIEMVTKMPLWKPGKQNGKNVSVKYSVPVKVLVK